MTEIIKCKCGNTFAACSDGYQNEEWRDARKDYLANGCTVEFIESENLNITYCSCVKTTAEAITKTQKALF